MKKKILLLIGIFSIGISLQAQVGINTKNPQALFHIDGKGDTSGANNSDDDLVITNEGNIGIGTLYPSAKIHLKSSKIGNAIRIKDGTQFANKILTTDLKGNASWIKAPSVNGVIHNLNRKTTYSANRNTLLLGTRVEETGTYLIYIRWWGISDSENAFRQTSAWFNLAVSDTNGYTWATDSNLVQSSMEYYVMRPTNSRFFCFGLSLSANAEAGQFLKLYIQPAIGGDWHTGTVSVDKPWNPSIIVHRI